MAYELDDFCNDCRQALSDGAAPQALVLVKDCLVRLLANDPFIQRVFGRDAPPGLHLLHGDGQLGFQVLAHVNVAPRANPPHNHGESWAVYGQAIGYTDMLEFQRIDDGSVPSRAQLEMIRQYRLNPGDVGVYAPGVIHSIDYPANSRFIRVTGTDLDRIYRDAFDRESGTIKRMAPQQAS